jgi:SHS2 domain-containing protein
MNVANETYHLEVRWTGEHYEATSEVAGTVTGATFEEAVQNGERAIVAALDKAAKPRRRRGQARRRTVA